jgi:hypothetical protein
MLAVFGSFDPRRAMSALGPFSSLLSLQPPATYKTCLLSFSFGSSSPPRRNKMTAYFPSQAGYAQPVVYNSSVGYPQPYGVAGSYAQPAGGVMYVPSHGSRRHGRHRRRHHDDYNNDYLYSVPQVANVGAPMVMVRQPFD